MADDFTGKIEVLVDYQGSPSGGGGSTPGTGSPSSSFRPQNIEAHNFLRNYPKPAAQMGAIRAIKAQEAVWKSQTQEVRKTMAEQEKHYKEIEAAQQLTANAQLMSIQTRMANDQELAAAHAERDRLELAAVKKRIELTKENGIKIKTALEKQTNERLSQLSIESAENQVAHAKVIQMYKQREAKQQLLRSRQQTRRARIGANQAAQRSNKGDDERNKYLKLMAAGVGALAITFGIGEMFKNSKVANTLLGTIAKMLGMMVDLFIKPFLPILIPLLRWLGKFIQGFSKFINDPTGWIKDKTGIGLPEQLNAPLAAAAGGVGLGALTLALSSRARGAVGRGIGGIFGRGGGGGGTPPIARPPIRPPRVPPTAGVGRVARGAGRLGIITAGLSGLSDLLSKVDWGKHLTGVGNFFKNLFGREAISKYLNDIKAFFKIFVWEEHLEKVAKFFSNKIFKFDEHLTKVGEFF